MAFRRRGRAGKRSKRSRGRGRHRARKRVGRKRTGGLRSPIGFRM